MFWLNTKRIIRTGFLSFWRNGFVSLSSILVVTVTLFTIIVIIFTNVVLESVLSDMKSKVDVNVYFITTAPEQDILAMRDSLNKLSEVSSVKYVSREQALQEFKDKHKDDYLTIQGLDELGDNPLGGRLNIIAKDPSQYEGIVKTIEDKNALVALDQSIIDKVNYRQNKVVIDRLSAIINGAKQLGFLLALTLMFISILITLNTIRLVIYMSREEIAVMRLVGASNMYVRGPFVVGGAIYGVISATLAVILFWPIAIWLARATTDFFGGVNLYKYYIQNFFQIYFIVLLAGIFLGSVSSFLAVRKYLKV
jgi:cell division transport system permease protein